MKFDPFVWDEVKTNEEIQRPKGKLQLRLSAPGAVYVTSQGYEALVGYGTSFDLDLAEPHSIRVEAGKGIRAFIYAPAPTTFVAVGEVFTNPDRLPHESGSMAEVLRARRMLEIERRAMMKEMRSAHSEMIARIRQNTPPENPVIETEEPAEQGEPEPEADE